VAPFFGPPCRSCSAHSASSFNEAIADIKLRLRIAAAPGDSFWVYAALASPKLGRLLANMTSPTNRKHITYCNAATLFGCWSLDITFLRYACQHTAHRILCSTIDGTNFVRISQAGGVHKYHKPRRRFAPRRLDADNILGQSSWVMLSETQQLSYVPMAVADATPICYLCGVARRPPSANDRPTCNTR